MSRWLLALAIGAAICWWSLGCGGGGGGGPTAPPPPTPGVAFTPAGVAGEQTIHLAKVTVTDASVLRLEVRASMVEDLFGLGFDLDYPENLVSWSADGSGEADFLGSDGADTDFRIREKSPGNLIVGLTRLGQVPGLDGSGVLLVLEFSSIANGSGSMVFAANDTFDSTGERQRDTEWLAGNLRVTLQ